MQQAGNVQRLIKHFSRERVEPVYNVSEGTADHTKNQKTLKARVDHIITKCKKNGTTHEDDEFPNAAHESAEVLKITKQWRRIENICPTGANGRTKWSMFDNPQPSDVHQGTLGNCWIVSAMSAISDKPYILDRIFVTKKLNKQGVYGLQLFVDGEWRYIIVDDRFPCNEDGKLIFAMGEKLQLWVPLLEKALAKLFGSYGALDEGCIDVGYTLLTGAPVESFFSASHLSNKEARKSAFITFRYALKDNFLLSCNSQDTDEASVLASVGLESSHTYSILKAAVVDQDQLLLLRNIWGKRSFTGKWSPNSDHWQKVKNKNTLPETNGDASKGVFWISIEDVGKYFDSISVCYARKNYHEYHIKAVLPQEQNEEWETFEVEVGVKTCIDISFKPVEGVKSFIAKPIHATVFIFDENEQVIGSTDCHIMNVTIWKAKILNPGIYQIRLFAFQEWNTNITKEYNFVVYSSREVDCRKISKPIVELRTLLGRLLVMLGEQTQKNERILYSFPEKLWTGSILLVSNESETDEIGFEITKILYENLVSTRTLNDTYDVIPPGHSQIVQILSPGNEDSGKYTTNFTFSAKKLASTESTRDKHQPVIVGDAVKLHGVFPTHMIKQ